MLYKERVGRVSEIHTQHTNLLFGENVEFLNGKVCGT